MSEKVVRYSFDLPEMLHKKLKTFAAFEGIKMNKYVTDLIENDINSKLQIPNQETLDAMKETDDIISGTIKSNPVSLSELKKLIG